MSGLGAMMTGGNPDDERGRQKDDYYPTPPDVTEALVSMVNDWIIKNKVWEPCAGDGAMLDVLASHAIDVVGSDIAPKRPDISSLDFLRQTQMLDDSKVIVTNPPFNLAGEIITHSFDIGAEGLALVLKSTYWHAKGRKALFDRHRPTAIMPLTWRPDFLGLGRPTMEVMWCVWMKPTNLAAPFYIPIGR